MAKKYNQAMPSRTSIPTYSLRERSTCGVELLRADHHTAGEPTAHAAHRDEHYVLIFQEKGRSRIMVDFEKITVKGAAVLTILPGQVHQSLAAQENTIAWFIALDVSWMNESFRAVFQNSPPKSPHTHCCPCHTSIKILYQRPTAGI
ncbi:AraC family ligand binding domain-containing protein [Paraflavitalea speifideaquila]|uniref:AraC family ligand binding domain-containing protein n=1 Tax=Paraflavitalea speifideaquila TaxID=3076558 RepID=UPI0028E81CC9|nr:AraC family ligand binding domain-containing protein [Paraflavitalea speifideiaquila]